MSEQNTEHLLSFLEEWERTIMAEIASHDLNDTKLYDDREVRHMLTQVTALKTGIAVGLQRHIEFNESMERLQDLQS